MKVEEARKLSSKKGNTKLNIRVQHTLSIVYERIKERARDGDYYLNYPFKGIVEERAVIEAAIRVLTEEDGYTLYNSNKTVEQLRW